MGLIPFQEVVSRSWRLLGVWDDLLLLIVAGALAVDRRRSAAPAAEWLLAGLLSLVALSAWRHGLTVRESLEGLRLVLPFAVLLPAAARLSPSQVAGIIRIWLVAAGLVILYGVVSYVWFRAIGGYFAFPYRPAGPLEAWVLWPYLCGGYPVPPGWRMVSVFLNDNYLGVWLSMVLPVAVAESRIASGRRRVGLWIGIATGVGVLTCTFSRTAAVTCILAVGLSGLWIHRKAVLLVLPALVAGSLAAIPNDTARFVGVASNLGGRELTATRAARGLLESPWLGQGPGSYGLADLHYAKLVYEWGIPAFLLFLALVATTVPATVAALRSFSLEVAAPHLRRRGIAISLLILPVAAVGGDVWEIPQLAITAWGLAGMMLALQRESGAWASRHPRDPLIVSAKSDRSPAGSATPAP